MRPEGTMSRAATYSPTQADRAIPPDSELYTVPELSMRHGRLLPVNRLRWAVRNRKTNGLEAAGGVFESPTGQHLLHEPTVLRWLLGLSGRSKPRAPRESRENLLGEKRSRLA
jgi:hypothetical protein